MSPSPPIKSSPAANPFAQAGFVLSAARLEQLPADAVPELAFVGRSNAGKSSALNKLCNQKSLARVSKTPGRTQLINLFEVPGRALQAGEAASAASGQSAVPRPRARLVDLPGYGYAAVPGAVRQDWGRLIGGYLEQRENLRLLIMIMDIRHPLTELDEQMLDWAEAAKRPCHLLLTKADKLSHGAASGTLLQVRRALPRWSPDFTAQTYSSHSGLGVDEARAAIGVHLASPRDGQ